MPAAAGQVRSVRTVAASVSRRHRSPSRCGESPLGGRGCVRTLCAPAIARACSSYPSIALMVERRRRRQWRARCCRLGSLGKLRRSRSLALAFGSGSRPSIHPKTCSTVQRLTAIASGIASSLRSMASQTASCSRRRMRLFARRATAAGRSGLELLAGRAAIGIDVRLIDERLLPQAKGLGWRRVGLGHRRNDACLGAGADLLAVTLPLSFRLEVS